MSKGIVIKPGVSGVGMVSSQICQFCGGKGEFEFHDENGKLTETTPCNVCNMFKPL